jgi:hypothetical protein
MTQPLRIMVVIDPAVDMDATAEAVVRIVETLGDRDTVLVHNGGPGIAELIDAIDRQGPEASISAEHLPTHRDSRNIIAITLWRWDVIESGCDAAILAPVIPIKYSTLESADMVFMSGAVSIGSDVRAFMIRNGAIDDFGTDADAYMAVFEHEWISWVDPTRSAYQSDWP